MNSQVEVLEGLERRVVLTLPRDEIETEVGKRLQKIAKNVRMDGFRPGKAPMKLVANRYGEEVRGDVMGEALQKRFLDATRDQGIKVAGYPRFEPAQTAEGSADTSFAAVFEVMPEIVLGDVSQIKLAQPVTEVTDADVD